MGYHDGYNDRSGEITIDIRNDLEISLRLIPTLDDEITLEEEIILEDDEYYDFEIIMKPIICNDNSDRSKRITLLHNDEYGENEIYVKEDNNYEDILLLLIKSLYYDIKVRYVDVNGHTLQCHLYESLYEYDDKFIKEYLDNIKTYLNKK